MDHDAYRAFIASKALAAERHGFVPAVLPDRLFRHQRLAAISAAVGPKGGAR